MASYNDPTIDALVDQLEPSELAALLQVGICGDVLPCPFCGEPPLVESDEHPADPVWSVSCENPDCSVLVAVTSTHGRQDAVRQWNTRSTGSSTLDTLMKAASSPIPEIS